MLIVVSGLPVGRVEGVLVRRAGGAGPRVRVVGRGSSPEAGQTQPVIRRLPCLRVAANGS
ncbi:hypothetical protein GCM10023339_03880 [Alloalcanivorax gelatiniphagus]